MREINYMEDFPSPFSFKIKVLKKIWFLVWFVTISWLPKAGFNGWIRRIYRLFGAPFGITNHPIY